jgi:hypothetical protein
LDELLGDGSETHGVDFLKTASWASKIKGKEVGLAHLGVRDL